MAAFREENNFATEFALRTLVNCYRIYEFDRDNNWDRIEEICKKLSGNDELWYATNIEIYDYVEAYKRLVYSANGRKIYNPTLLTIWIDVDGVVYSIKPGETIDIE